MRVLPSVFIGFIITIITIGLVSCATQLEWPATSCSPKDKIAKIATSTLIDSTADMYRRKSLGYLEGDKFPEVVLVKQNGSLFKVYDWLEKHRKPMLFVAGSFTCPMFRARVDKLNDLYKLYKNDVFISVVYTVEAHPDKVKSPYRQGVWQVPKNEILGILYPQATTYGERVECASKMIEFVKLECKVLFDGPDNKYWNDMGQAPVFTYLIDADGTIVKYQLLFERDEMEQSIKKVLERNTNSPAISTPPISD